MLTAFWILAILMLAQSVWALIGGFEFERYVRSARNAPLPPDGPFASVIIPCKGMEPGMESLLAGYLAQDYSSFEVIFIVATENDSAYPILKKQSDPHKHSKSGNASRVEVVVAGLNSGNGEKVNNLLRGLEVISPQSLLLVFADADAHPERDWLRSLTSPLSDPRTTVSTGFRWYIPNSQFGSRLQAVWDSSVATMLGPKPAPFAWGGSMAIRRTDFEGLKIAEKYWSGTISDDYALTRAVIESGGTIRFVPRCLLATRANPTIPQFWEWADRQIMITRVYAPKLWVMGLAGYSLNCLTTLLGIASILRNRSLSHLPEVILVLLLIQLLGVFKGKIRGSVAADIFPEEPSVRQFKACYWRLAPLVPWIMMANFLASAIHRRVKWRGTEYELLGKNLLRIISRREA